MSKTPRMQIMSSSGSGRAQFLIFLRRGVRGVSPEVWTFSGSTLKRLKWFFEAAFEPRDYQNLDLHVMEHHLDRLLYGFVHYESSFGHFIEKQTWRVLKSFSSHSLTRLSIGTEHRSYPKSRFIMNEMLHIAHQRIRLVVLCLKKNSQLPGGF